MKMTLLPGSSPGKWALALSLAFIILILLKMQNIVSLPVPTFAIAVFGLAGFIMSIVAIVRNKDFSVLNLFPLLVGLLIVLWIAAEILFPH